MNPVKLAILGSEPVADAWTPYDPADFGGTKRNVGDGKTYSTIAAAISAASAGDTICIYDKSGGYTETTYYDVDKNLSILCIDTPSASTQLICGFYVHGATLNCYGLYFNMQQSNIVGTLYITAGTTTFERCYIRYSDSSYSSSEIITITGDCTLDFKSCIVNGYNSNSNYVPDWLLDNSYSDTITLTNCLCINCGTFSYYTAAGNTSTFYNCYGEEGSSDAWEGGTNAGDYNAGSDTSAPGANSVDNAAVATHFDTTLDSVQPKTGSSLLTAGTSAQKPACGDYFGWAWGDDTPIGAISKPTTLRLPPNMT